MNVTNLPIRIQEWFLARNITLATLEANNIQWDADWKEIVIPIFDKKGNHLFNKRRRDPAMESGPKYRYDTGATVSLYGIHRPFTEPLFITEGELDALVLQSLGFTALSSTGGANSFQREWRLYFDGFPTYICYDNDAAGITGAMRTQSMIPHAKILSIPLEDGVKDVTDFFKKHTISDWMKLMAEARTYPIPEPLLGIPQSKTHLKVAIAHLRTASDEILNTQRELRGNGQDTRLTESILDYIRHRLEFYQRHLQSFRRRGPQDGDEVRRAKEVPIHKYVQFQPNGFAKCLWHTEKTASMKYNDLRYDRRPNSVKCFACSASGDVIDVVMALYNLEFKDAINHILNK